MSNHTENTMAGPGPDDKEILSKLYEEKFGTAPDSVVKMPGAGGDRRYYRLNGRWASAIGVGGDSLIDCEAFVKLTPVFRENGVNVPEIYAVAPGYMHYLQQDLGDTSLFSLIQKGSPEVEPLVERTLEMLVKLQTIPVEKWVDDAGYYSFSREQVMWDLNYFKYEFLKPAGVAFDEYELEYSFMELAGDLVVIPPEM